MSSEAERWDDDLDERATPAPLLQTWAWGEVQVRAGWTVERVKSPSHGTMASVLTRKVGPVREAYIPRGPVPATPEAVDSIVNWSRASGMARVVVEPEAPETFAEVLTEKRFTRIAPTQPQHTRILKLLPTSTYLQIAETLYISRNTVKVHLRSVYQKLGVASRAQAIERAVDLSLL